MRFFLASANPNKAREFQALARGLPVEIAPASELGGMPPVEESAGSFEGNARLKARALLPVLPQGCWALSDDSGLCVDALGGRPGVDSAYYAGHPTDAAANLAKLVSDLREVPAPLRRAHFRCVLLALGPAGQEHVFEGRCDGTLLEGPRGASGFGYDPLFVPDGFALSFAELGDSAKNGLSHRSRAWAKFTAWALSTFSPARP